MDIDIRTIRELSRIDKTKDYDVFKNLEDLRQLFKESK